ncbi:MAG: hypothetical protein WC812_00255 [Candidatus Pacearchaeota archaeon]|jgi:hypothetical protein
MVDVDYGDHESMKCMRAYHKVFCLVIERRSLEDLKKDLEDIKSIPKQFYEKDFATKEIIEGVISRIEKKIKNLED